MGDSSGEEYYSAPESNKEEPRTGVNIDSRREALPIDQKVNKNSTSPCSVEPEIKDNDNKVFGSDTSNGDTATATSTCQTHEFVTGLDNRFVCDAQEVLEGGKVELSEEQIKELKEKANMLKVEGNTHFKAGDYNDAIECYSNAIEVYPPPVCNHEIAVCYANRAACHMKLENHQAVIDDCTQTLELESGYMKAILRRAQACELLEKYEDALADYKKALELDPTQSSARQAVVYLPEKIREQNEKLKSEMMGKLKELGNALLSPFGLSTNNFQLQQDPQTGSYSVNFKR